MIHNSSRRGPRPADAETHTPATGRRQPTRRRIGAKLLATDGSRVLLIRERRRDRSTFWTLPGGGINPDESLAAGLRREIDEELGCGCTVGRLVATCTYRHTTRPTTETKYAVFAGTLRSPPTPNPDEGIIESAWVDPDDLPASLLDPFRRVVARHPPRADRSIADPTTTTPPNTG